MEIDEDLFSKKGHHANIEMVDDEQFFEFKEVETVMNPDEFTYAESSSEN